MTGLISFNLFSMKCNMFNWLWIYLGIILIGTIIIFLIKYIIDMELSNITIKSLPFLAEFEKEFNMGIPDDQAESIATVGEAIKYIEDNAE